MSYQVTIAILAIHMRVLHIFKLYLRCLIIFRHERYHGRHHERHGLHNKIQLSALSKIKKAIIILLWDVKV